MGGLFLGDLLEAPMDAYEAALDRQEEPTASPTHVASLGVGAAGSLRHVGGKRIREPSPPGPAQSVGDMPAMRKARRKARKRGQRRVERQEAAAAEEADAAPSTYRPPPFVSSRFGNPEFKILPFNADSLPAARTVFVGKHLGKCGADMGQVFTLTELENRGITVIGWDGV
jgi:hypothetical protein